MKKTLILASMLACSRAFADDGAPVIQVSQNNSTTTALAGNATFTGKTDDLLHYQELDITLMGSPSNAPGTLYFEFSPDATHWDVSVPLTLTGPTIVPIPLRVVMQYFRVRYVNGATAQTTFRLTTVFHNISSTRLTRFLNQTVDDNEPIEMGRSVIMGRRPDGTYGNVVLTSANQFSVAIVHEGNLDVALSTRTKPSDQQHAIIDSGSVTNANLDVALSTRTKPADQQHAIVDSGTTTVTQATGSNLHVAVDSVPSTVVTNANLDVALSTRTKPSDQQHSIIDSGTTTVTQATGTNLHTVVDSLPNLDVALSTRTKPSDQQHSIVDSGSVTVSDGSGALNVIVDSGTLAATQSGTWNIATVAAVTAITNALPAGSNVIGHVISDTGSTTAVTGNVAVTNAGLSNLDVALSTRTKPADQQHTIVDVALPAGSNVIGHVINDTGSTTAITGTVTVTDTRLPASLGQTTMSGSLPVVLSSDQSAIPVSLAGNIAQETGGNLAAMAASVSMIGGNSTSVQNVYPLQKSRALLPRCNNLVRVNCQ